MFDVHAKADELPAEVLAAEASLLKTETDLAWHHSIDLGVLRADLGVAEADLALQIVEAKRLHAKKAEVDLRLSEPLAELLAP